MTELITVHAYEWEIHEANETGKENDSIYAWCLDRDSNPALVRFETYPNFFQLELPRFVSGMPMVWNEYEAVKFVQEASCWWYNKPLQVIYRPVKKTYYWANGQLTPMCMVSFANRKDMMFARKVFTGNTDRGCFTTKTYGNHVCDVWEADVHMLRKMLTMRNVPFSKWFRVRCDPVPQDEKVSTEENEWIAYWDHLNAVPDEECSSWSTNPRLLAIDIECYSSNHRRMPCKTSVEDVAYMISLIYQRLNHPETRKRYAVVFGDCGYIPAERLTNTEVITIPVSTKDGERTMISEFARLVRELNPEVITGYNILAFDYPYLDCRLNGANNHWPQMGRLKGVLPKMTSKNWKSGAYGHNSINILKMEGRISIDLLPIIRRDYKLPKYDLGTVSTKFLGRTKHDMSAPEMFKRYRENREARWDMNVAIEEALIELSVDPSNFYKHEEFTESGVANYDVKPLSDEIRNCRITEPCAKPLVSQALVDSCVIGRQQMADQLQSAYDKSHQREEELRVVMEEVQQNIAGFLSRNEIVRKNPELSARLDKASERYEKAKDDLTAVVLYCIQDSELCIDLFHKLTVWIGLIEMSNIVGVTIMEIFTQGQQIRCFSQLYDLAARSGYVLDARNMPVGHFAGGFVQEPVPGLYDNVVCLDFSSLYPSIMRAYNICYTTLVRPEWHEAVPEWMTETIVCEQEEPLAPTYVRPTQIPVDLEDDPNDDPVDDEIEDDNDLQEPSGGKVSIKAKAKTHTVTYVNKFIKCRYTNPETGETTEATGLLPRLVANLVIQRSAVRKILYKEKNPITKDVLDKRQLALKVSANSFFGFLGVKNGGKMPLIEGAMSITAMGRKLIGMVNDYIKDKYNGKIIYNDTDSTMAIIPLCMSSLECNYWGERLSQEISGIKKTVYDEEGKPSHLDADGKPVLEDRPGLFLSPLGMEFEKAMRMLCLKKKKYAALLINSKGKFKMLPKRDKNGDVIKDESGKPVDSEKYDMMTKGIVLARRDNPLLLRQIYQAILEMVMLREPFSKVMTYLFEYVGKLLRGEFPHTHFLVIKGLGANYKSDTYFMKVFAEEVQADGKLVSPGDRLEFLIVKHPDDGDKKKKVLLGKKMKLVEQYTEDPDKWVIDVNYYLEKILTNALDQLISIPYREIIEKLRFAYKPPRARNIRTLMDPVKVIQEWLKHGGSMDKLADNVMTHIRKVECPLQVLAPAPVMKTMLNLPPIGKATDAPSTVMMVWDSETGKMIEKEKEKDATTPKKVLPLKKISGSSPVMHKPMLINLPSLPPGSMMGSNKINTPPLPPPSQSPFKSVSSSPGGLLGMGVGIGMGMGVGSSRLTLSSSGGATHTLR